MQTIPEKALSAKQQRHAIETRAGVPSDWVANMHVTTGTAERQQKVTAANLDEAAHEMSAATDRILEAGKRLADAAKQTTLEAKSAIGRAKDVQAQLVDSLNRTNKILGADFEVRLTQLERMSAALSTLAELEKAGVLKNVISAISRPT